MNHEQFSIQSDRIARYKTLNDKIEEVEALLSKLEEGSGLILQAVVPYSSPPSHRLHDPDLVKGFIVQLETLRANYIHKRDQI